MKIGLLLILHLLCLHSTAQLSVGLSAGFTLTQPDKAPSQPFSRYIPAGGFAIAVPVQYTIGQYWAVIAEPGLLQKNISFERTDKYAGSWEKRYNNYLQIPLLLQYRTGQWKEFSGFVQAGFSAGYLIAARQEGAVPDIYDLSDTENPDGTRSSFFRIKTYNEKYRFVADKDQRFDFSAVASAGLNYHINNQTFYLEFRYSGSVNSYEKQYMSLQDRPKHISGAVLLGCMMNLFNR